MQISIEGILVNYQLLGTKSNKSLLILHGWGQTCQNWLDIAHELETNYQVILVDLPGFGRTSTPKTPFCTNDYANFVQLFLDKLGIKKVILIGHSFGGKISIVLASKSSVVEKLILISPSGIEKRNLWTTTKIITAKTVKPFLLLFPNSIQKKLFGLVASRDYLAANKLQETFKKIVKQNVSKLTKNIKVPTIIIWGENDKELNIKNALKLKPLIKGSMVRIIWGGAHNSHIDDKDKLINILEDYL